ncbi:hypothetical protein AB4Y90_14525 [Chryseobacterium sp. 2TAF14]|uniref:hypothetical protein n=1 Tax=Chryseobacterium sp. 2TAF14 TaxID=3233007 RepID=UPI003F93DF16
MKNDLTNRFVAKQIYINQLPEKLSLLIQGKTEFDFIGITSNGNDCIYFAKHGEYLDIEFEAIEKTQIPYYEKLKLFAFENKFKIEESVNKKIPYLKIKTNASIEETLHLAQKIQHDIFGNNENTKYEIVP